MSAQYQWRESPFSSKQKKEWILDLFNQKPSKAPLPLLYSIKDIAWHMFEAKTFSQEKKFQRAYTLEHISTEEKDDLIVTTQKKNFSSPYKGYIDAELVFFYAGDMDGVTRSTIGFLNGEFKGGDVLNKQVHTIGEYKTALDNYLGIKISKNIANVFKNSNLSEKIKERFSSLLK